MSQDEFCAALGEKPSKIRDIESGRQRVNDEFLRNLITHFPVDLNWLFDVPGRTDTPDALADRPKMGIFGPLEQDFGPLEHPALSRSPAPAPLAPGMHEGGTGDALSIPWLEPRLDQGSAPIRLSFSWLQSVDLVIDRLRAVIADEVQLPGCLAGATLALVEVPTRPSEVPECWAFYEDGRLLIARAQAQGAATILLPVDAGGRARFYQPTDLSFRQLGADVFFILTGEHSTTPAPLPSADNLPPRLRERLANAIAAVEAGLDAVGRSAKPDLKAELVLAAYDLLSQDGERATAEIIRLVRA